MAHSTLDKLVFASYNMKLSLRDKRARYADEMEPLDPLDIIERAFDRSDADNDGDDELHRWIDPVHMDGADNVSDPLVESHARTEGINVEQVLIEEVGVDTVIMIPVIAIITPFTLDFIVSIFMVRMIVCDRGRWSWRPSI